MHQSHLRRSVLLTLAAFLGTSGGVRASHLILTLIPGGGDALSLFSGCTMDRAIEDVTWELKKLWVQALQRLPTESSLTQLSPAPKRYLGQGEGLSLSRPFNPPPLC